MLEIAANPIANMVLGFFIGALVGAIGRRMIGPPKDPTPPPPPPPSVKA